MMISPSPLLCAFSLCAIFLILYSLEFPPSVCGFSTEPAAGNETDMQSLLAFKDGITSDPFGALKSWNHSTHFCQWFGVTCGRLHRQRVTMLKLDHQRLKGSISPHIGNLSFLRELWLRNNTLGQRIPPEVGRLQRLQMLSLRNNSIGGEIPVNISRCSKLVYLELSGNDLEGKIPVEFGMLSKLEVLAIGVNFKIGGHIPSSLANMSSLQVFYASRNNMGGSIPDEMGRLKNLNFFVVDINKLVGTIPPPIWNISSMETFSVGRNQIGGSLPSELGGVIFPRLTYLHIYTNLFTGSVPVSISNASYLERLDMSENKLTGDVPRMEKLVRLRIVQLYSNSLGNAGKVLDDLSFLTSFTNSTSLEIVSLSTNNFGGELPRFIGNLSTNNLRKLLLDNNKLSGSIPSEIGNLLNLESLWLWGNELTGNIPSTIGKLKNLGVLALDSNKLTGTIPLSLGNLTLLYQLWLAQNNLHGNIPSSFEKYTNLQVLYLSSNNLQGHIPREIFSTQTLYALGLGNNHLTGPLPSEVGTLINLNELDISENMLTGKIPSSLGLCVTLTVLHMDSNNFGGSLPPYLSSLRGLSEFNLSRNNFSGKIPDYLASFLFLQILDLSYNDFEGAVPDRGVFKNVTAFHMEGNTKLCGGILELRLPGCNSKAPTNNKKKLIMVLAFGIAGVVVMLAFLYLCFSKKPRKLPTLYVPWNSHLKLSYQSLHEATDGFSTNNLIGLGSFGSVYKGLLHQGQRIIAVKVLNLQQRGASRSFVAECEALRRIRHRNLLKVLTACSSIDHQGNDFKALVYEFMPNGSLYDWLHLHESQDEMQAPARILDLSQRLDIVIGVASAVEYLHHRCEEPIVHCDLKPSNILLDSDMVAHVGDFGLAKLIQEGTSIQSSDNQSSTIGLRGSVGYVAPEYGMGNEVSTYGDVYSFGIIVLEMFSGKRPTELHLFDGCLNLRDYVEKALPKEIENVVDSRLLTHENWWTTQSNTQGIDSTPSSEKIKECLFTLFKVGIACAQELPRDRMAINDAIAQLHAVKKAFVKTGAAHSGGRAMKGLKLDNN